MGDTILVCDIGGGTTDFLDPVQEEDGVLQLARVAVGDHILLGGDNMDLALAYGSQQSSNKRVSALMIGRCVDWFTAAGPRKSLLAEDSQDSYPLAIASRGSRLWAARFVPNLPELSSRPRYWKAFPMAADARPQVPRRMGLTTLGLPYASDAGVTRHLAAFLARAQSAAGMTYPTAILFNGV